MLLRLLIPLALVWPVMALAAEGTALRNYRGRPVTELLGLFVAIILFFALWFGISGIIGGTLGIVAASLLAAALSPVLLFLGYKIFGVKPGSATAH